MTLSGAPADTIFIKAISMWPYLSILPISVYIHHMEQIILSFDIKGQRISYDEASALRKEISDSVDKALRDAGAGKWTGGSYNLHSIEIFIRTGKPEDAVQIVERVMDGHRLRDCMAIVRE
jgi:hypothetical protein